jgi:hypothetical protein
MTEGIPQTHKHLSNLGLASANGYCPIRKLAPSDGWQTAPAAVARRVVEEGQEDAAADEAVVLEEDLSDEEADSAPVCFMAGTGN